jgi:hypothetical protein
MYLQSFSPVRRAGVAALPMLFCLALVSSCIPGGKGAAVCDGELQADEEAYASDGEGGIDAPWDEDGDGAFDASNADCAAVYAAHELDCDDADPEVNGAASEVACNGKDDDCDEATADAVDADADEVCDALDVCLGFDDRTDADADGKPDGCDLCPLDAADDVDSDGVCDSIDLCGGYDDNVDSDADLVPDGCDFCVGNDPGELFASDMTGCPGTVNWTDRATLCTTGFTPCTGQQWVDRRAGSGPTYNYWTDDELGYDGDDGVCYASLTAPYPCEGEIPAPMRVCGGYLDGLGNECNWIGCGWDGDLTNEYFGGCDGNLTAGTLCCR